MAICAIASLGPWLIVQHMSLSMHYCIWVIPSHWMPMGVSSGGSHVMASQRLSDLHVYNVFVPHAQRSTRLRFALLVRSAVMAAPAFKRLREVALGTSIPEEMPTCSASVPLAQRPAAEPTPEEIMAAPAVMNPCCVDCLAVFHVPNIMELVPLWHFYDDKKCIAMVEECVGSFWKVASSFNGHPVYKREVTFADDGLELGQMYIFFSVCKKVPDWVLARTLLPQVDDYVGWAPLNARQGFYPEGKVHVPWWSSKGAGQMVPHVMLLLRLLPLLLLLTLFLLRHYHCFYHLRLPLLQLLLLLYYQHYYDHFEYYYY